MLLSEIFESVFMISTEVSRCWIKETLIKAVEVFRETAIGDFDIAEILLDNQAGTVLLVEINAHERPHGIAVINGIFNSNIRQIEPDLHKVHAKHCLNAFYGTTTLSGRIEWQNHRNPCGPWNHGIHSIEEFFAACLLWALIVFKVYERLLFHEKISPFITHFICYLYFTGKIYFRRENLD